jgi:hypothetical protein
MFEHTVIEVNQFVTNNYLLNVLLAFAFVLSAMVSSESSSQRGANVLRTATRHLSSQTC